MPSGPAIVVGFNTMKTIETPCTASFLDGALYSITLALSSGRVHRHAVYRSDSDAFWVSGSAFSLPGRGHVARMRADSLTYQVGAVKFASIATGKIGEDDMIMHGGSL